MIKFFFFYIQLGKGDWTLDFYPLPPYWRDQKIPIDREGPWQKFLFSFQKNKYSISIRKLQGTNI